MNSPHTSAAALWFLIGCSLKCAIVLAATWALVRLLSKHSASYRHLAWSMGILASLAIPALSFFLPTWHAATVGSAAAKWSIARAGGVAAGHYLGNAASVDARSTPWIWRNPPAIPLFLWLAGFLFFASRLAVGLLRLAKISTQAQVVMSSEWARAVAELGAQLEIARPVQLLRANHLAAIPVTWGLRRPVILLPADAEGWSEGCKRIVLSHELAHIRRKDWLLQICAEIARAVYWFLPLVGIAAKRLREESERASDDCVLSAGVPPHEYATDLLELARTLQGSAISCSSALALARTSSLERRVKAMLDPTTNRSTFPRNRKFLTALATLCLLLPLAVLRLPAQNVAPEFSGAVHDPSGAAVPNATLILTNEKIKSVVMTTTDASGNFTFKDLPAGEYELKAVKRGFQDYANPRVTVQAGQAALLNIPLEIAPVSDEIDVVAQGKPGHSAHRKQRIRIGGEVEAAQRINLVQPVYPAAAKEAGVQGTVILHAVIGTDGAPLSLRVMNNEIDPQLARSAVEAVSKWRYRPTLLNGQPVEVDTTVKVNYTLVS